MKAPQVKAQAQAAVEPALDNSGEITPSRGDAPVQIAVWAADKK
ncbi:hypothetical protein [Paraburkholderia sp. RL17-337-BIB-A]